MGLADDGIEYLLHLVGVGEGAFGTQGDAHHVGHLEEAMVVVVLEGEDIGAAGETQKGLFEGHGFVDYLVKEMVGSHTCLAFDGKKGVGFDEDHVELVVVLVVARTGNANPYGYLLGFNMAGEDMVDVLFEPTSGKVVEFLGAELTGFLWDKGQLGEELVDGGGRLAATWRALADGGDFHRATGTPIHQAEQLEGGIGLLGESARFEAFENIGRLGVAADGGVGSGVAIVGEAMQLEILANGHAVGDGLDGVVVVVDAIVEDGADDEVFARLDIIEPSVELFEHMLDGQGRIARATSKVNPVRYLLGELRPQTPTNALIDVAVLTTMERNDGDLLLGDMEKGGVGGHIVTVLARGDKEEAVAWLIVLFQEKICRRRLLRVEDIDKCFHFSNSMQPWCCVLCSRPWPTKR